MNFLSVNAPSSARENDIDLYTRVANELNENQRHEGMWLKAFAEAEGDENKATAIYARLRVESLKAEASKAINLEGGKRPKKWVESEEVTIPEETAAELYHRAHNARFLGKRKDLGAELYEELIKRFPETKEARYAKAHIKTLRTGSPTH